MSDNIIDNIISFDLGQWDPPSNHPQYNNTVFFFFLHKKYFLSLPNTGTSQNGAGISEMDSSQSITSHSSSRYKTSIIKWHCWCNYAAHILNHTCITHHGPCFFFSGSTLIIRHWLRLERVRQPNCSVQCCRSLPCMRSPFTGAELDSHSTHSGIFIFTQVSSSSLLFNPF